MARIVIPAHTLESFFDESSEINVTSFEIDTHSYTFSWGNRSGMSQNEPEVQYDINVREDLVLELDGYMDMDTYNETKESLDIFKEALDIERVVSNTLETRLRELEVRLKEQAETTKKYIEMCAKLEASKNPWWKLWQ